MRAENGMFGCARGLGVLTCLAGMGLFVSLSAASAVAGDVATASSSCPGDEEGGGDGILEIKGTTAGPGNRVMCCMPPGAPDDPTCLRMATTTACVQAGGVPRLSCARCRGITIQAGDEFESEDAPAAPATTSLWPLLAFALLLLPVAPMVAARRRV